MGTTKNYGRVLWVAVVVLAVAGINTVVRSKTIAERVQQYGDSARTRLKPFFVKAGANYPPGRAVLVGLKQERVVQLYAAGPTNGYHFVHSWPIQAASGVPGPKLQEGDGQVPEGIYSIESLNPNSRFHLSLRVGYPNAFDRAQAAKEGRTSLGGDIMIHGGAASIGCLAMGDPAAEELFVLAADTGLDRITLILAPVDFRTGAKVPAGVPLPAWTAGLYSQIRERLAELPRPSSN